jgi:FkbM family methyltransferase
VGHREIGLGRLHELQRESKHRFEWADGMYCAGSDDGVALRLLSGLEYEPVSRRVWSKLCAGAELVIDVGAHTGRFTLDAYLAGAKAVLAVEPNPVNYGRLCLNVRANRFNPEGLFFGAAGDRNGVAEFSVPSSASLCSSGGRLGRDAKHDCYPVRMVRIDDLLLDELRDRVRAVKVDVEGSVGAVLRGIPKILESHPPLILEVIEGGLTEILKPLGYRFWRINEGTGAIVESPDCEPNDTFDESSRNVLVSVNGIG